MFKHNSKIICPECEGTGNLSSCCFAPISYTKPYKCSNCNKYCKVEYCYECDGTGYLSKKNKLQFIKD